MAGAGSSLWRGQIIAAMLRRLGKLCAGQTTLLYVKLLKLFDKAQKPQKKSTSLERLDMTDAGSSLWRGRIIAAMLRQYVQAKPSYFGQGSDPSKSCPHLSKDWTQQAQEAACGEGDSSQPRRVTALAKTSTKEWYHDPALYESGRRESWRMKQQNAPMRTSATSPQSAKKLARSSSVADQGRFLTNTVELPCAAESSSAFAFFAAAGFAACVHRHVRC
jgi:hypothetical protein